MTAAISSMTAARNRPGPTVSAGYARALFNLAVELGADPQALSEQAGLAPRALEDPDARVAFTVFKALMRAGKALSGEPALALRFGAASPLQKISIVGLAAYAAENVTGVLAQLNRFGRLLIEAEGLDTGDRFVLVRRDGGTWLEDRRADPNAFPELTESTWARFVREFRHFHPDRPYVKAVHVTHAAPTHAEAYAAILGAPVTFDSGWNALQVEDDWPNWPNWRIGRPNRYVFGVFSQHAEDLLKSLEAATSLRARIERLLIPTLHTGQFSMDHVARELGLSRATLYRRLRDEDVRYEALLDDLRARMARHYLDGRKVSPAEVAYLTGFSDPSAFSRAYLRWTGQRPGAARRRPQMS
jgi:AraC-like DNA-binding protein